MRIFLRILITVFVVYILVCGLLFFVQEKLIFFPEKLARNFTFNFSGRVEEVDIKMADGKLLNGLLFKSDHSKGLIFYLHGNAGSLSAWGDVAKTYTDLNYDVFILDYRGFGKSEGSINSQGQLFRDVQTAYDAMKERYPENEIVVLGYSVGTGLAAKVASTNHPRLLVLQAPYYSFTDMMKRNYPLIPTFILKYKLETNKYIQDCKMPIVIFHGNADEVIYYGASLKLKELIKTSDTLITLNGQGHNGMTANPDYIQAIKRILN